MKAIEELKPCPFCGGEAVDSARKDESLWSHNIVDWYVIGCVDCDFEFNQCENDNEIIKRWNNRAYTEEIINRLDEETRNGLFRLRNYFLEHDLTAFEHWAYKFISDLINPTTQSEE